MKKVLVVTTNRADYGGYRPVLDLAKKQSKISLELLVSGTHLSKKHGYSVREIEKDGFKIAGRILLETADDSPFGVAKTSAEATLGFAMAYKKLKPDLILLFGDRFEMHSAAVAAVPFLIPIAHIHGGESTEGAIDHLFRNSISQLSDIHFVATEEYKTRLIEMGINFKKIFVSGAPSLNNIDPESLPNPADLIKKYKLPFQNPPILVSFHPTTREFEKTQKHTKALLDALRGVKTPIVFVSPNNDTSGNVIHREIEKFVNKDNKNRCLVPNFSHIDYLGILKWSLTLIGNSSSGIIEAPYFHLPAINIGNRQKGRIRVKNVIDVAPKSEEIISGLKKAFSNNFRKSLKKINNLYYKKDSAKIILTNLTRWFNLPG